MGKPVKVNTITVKIDQFKKQKLTKFEKLGNVPTSISIGSDILESTNLLEIPTEFNVILFDYQSDFFKENKKLLPIGYNYIFVKSVEELNQNLNKTVFQILVLNYDVASKSMNKISAEVRRKLPKTRVIIVSKAIAPEKAVKHAQTEAGASAYYQLPIETTRIEREFCKIHADYLAEENR